MGPVKSCITLSQTRNDAWSCSWTYCVVIVSVEGFIDRWNCPQRSFDRYVMYRLTTVVIGKMSVTPSLACNYLWQLNTKLRIVIRAHDPFREYRFCAKGRAYVWPCWYLANARRFLRSRIDHRASQACGVMSITNMVYEIGIVHPIVRTRLRNGWNNSHYATTRTDMLQYKWGVWHVTSET